MKSKTAEELRALARTLGLKGYAGLRKAELIRLLEQAAGAARAEPAIALHPAEPAAAAHAPEAPAAAAHPEPTARLLPEAARPLSAEERVEIAKYAITAPGMALAARALAADLDEDIERLPAARESILSLLPQKPGVLHAYWALAPGSRDPAGLRLRLCRMGAGGIEVLEEVALSGAHGHWYFHVPAQAEPGEFYVQLGGYAPDGGFASAIDRGIARIPSLYASERADRLWWITEERFRAMYLRAGGIVRGARLLWPGAFSSR